MHKDEVKVVVKNFPLNFHKQARDAAKVALAADKQKTCGPSKNESCYKDMYHLIFCGTTDSVMPDQCNAWRKLKTNPDLPYEYATQLNLDLVKLKQDAKDPALENLIKKDIVPSGTKRNLKFYENKNSRYVLKYFKKNDKELIKHISLFKKELNYIGATDKTILIALGNGTYEILKNANLVFKVSKLTHYSSPTLSKKNYKKEVNKLIKSCN